MPKRTRSREPLGRSAILMKQFTEVIQYLRHGLVLASNGHDFKMPIHRIAKLVGASQYYVRKTLGELKEKPKHT